MRGGFFDEVERHLAFGILGDVAQGEVGESAALGEGRRQGVVAQFSLVHQAGEGRVAGVDVAVGGYGAIGVVGSAGAHGVDRLRVADVEGVGSDRGAHQRFIDVVYNQAVARQGLVERAHLLAVFEDEILAGDGGVDAIRGGIGGGTGHVADGGGGFQGDGVDPAVLDFLPHVETGGAVAVVAAPGAVAHDVPDAGAGEVAAGEFVVGVVEVGGAEVVAELVADYADGAHFAGAKHFRFDGVAAHFDAVECEAVDFGGVRPDVVAGAGHFLAVALVDYGQAVEHAIAVVVEFREVDVFIDVFQAFHNHGHGAVGAVVVR